VGLIDDALAARLLPGPTCAVQRILATRPDVADDLSTMLRDKDTFSAAMIISAATRNGLEHLSRFTIERHRKNECRNCKNAGVLWG